MDLAQDPSDRALPTQERDVEARVFMQDAHELPTGVTGGSEDGNTYGGTHRLRKYADNG